MSYTQASLGCILVLSQPSGNMYLLYICVNMYLLYIPLFSFTCAKCLSCHLVACSHRTLVPIMALYIISITKSVIPTTFLQVIITIFIVVQQSNFENDDFPQGLLIYYSSLIIIHNCKHNDLHILLNLHNDLHTCYKQEKKYVPDVVIP